jgi:recombination protein RecA
MAKKDKITEGTNSASNADFTTSLIKSLNKEMGERVAYNLAIDDAPTIVRRWISTGSIALDYIISNRRNGGIPEGRIIEFYGPPSIGKSHIALQISKSVQKMGGVVVYIDSENATNVELLASLGLDVTKRFVYVEETCTEHVFSIMERTIMKAREMDKDVPVVIVWDSVAATSPLAEIHGDYDKDSIGLQARTLAKGFRKITSTIGCQRVTLVCLNQMKTKIGVLYGDPDTTPGGQAIPFHASVRVKLTSGKSIKGVDKGYDDERKDDVIGINVIATTVKNKISSPRRKANFEIHFGRGIEEAEQLLDEVNGVGEITRDGYIISCGGNSTWKEFKVALADTGEVLHTKKFVKKNFGKLLANQTWRPYIDYLLDSAFIKQNTIPTLESEVEAEEEMADESITASQSAEAGVNAA